jgi:hypothetical protein
MLALGYSGMSNNSVRSTIDQYKYERFSGKYRIMHRDYFFGMASWVSCKDTQGNDIIIDSEWDANKLVRKLNLGKDD